MIAITLTQDYDLQISEDSGASFLTVSGLNSLTFDETPSDIDITTFDNNGWSSMVPGIRTGVVNAAGFRLTDADTGARDAGQKAVEKAARQNGFAGRRLFRLVWKEDTAQYIEFNGYPKNGQFGGGLNAATPWSVTVSLDGAPTFEGAAFSPDA